MYGKLWPVLNIYSKVEILVSKRALTLDHQEVMKTFIDKVLPNYDPKYLYVVDIPYGAPYLKLYQVGDMYCFSDDMIDPETK